VEGLFITFEGPDGSGKTTQMRMLGERLKASGHDVVLTREPGGTSISDRIREIILSPVHAEMQDETEILLYAASRAQHVREVIRPALDRGVIVLCDRFVDASIAYQGYGLGHNPEEVAAISRFATGGLQPHRTYLLDVPVEVSRERLVSRAGAAGGAGLDRIEQKETDYHERVRDGFLLIAKADSHRVLLLSANRSVEEIEADIIADCDRWLEGWRQPKC
jgi:dTMP kinase